MVIVRKFKAIDHKKVYTTVAAACESKGSRTTKCEVCGKTLSTETIPALGHTYNSIAEVKATCVDVGVKAHFECATCGKVFDSAKKGTTLAALKIAIDKNNHVGGDLSFSKTEHFTLCACGEHLNAEAHKFGDWAVISEATEDEGETKARICKVCGFEENETTVAEQTIAKLGDIDDDGKISAADARLALRASVGLKGDKDVHGLTINCDDKTSRAFKAADVDFDDKISAADARLILRASVGLENPKNWKKIK